MALSSDLISQFVKVTKDDKKVSKETTVYGTIVYDGKPYVKLDGSNVLTPIDTTANVKDGDRVTVMIKDHTATVTGNLSSPSARSEDVEYVASQVTEFEIVTAHKVTTNDIQATNAIIENLIAIAGKYREFSSIEADIETLRANYIEGKTIWIEDIEAITAEIESIGAKFGTFTDISADDLQALDAEITNLKGYTADFTYISAVRASVKEIDAEKLSAEDAELKYVNINFGNINKAWMEEFYARSGLIEYITADGVSITGRLVGVTIQGDLIEANTLVADKLVIQGEDGLYYKLNFESGNFTNAEEVPTDGLHGSVIVAKSVTAEKVAVDDLVAFGATIGGFHITNDSLYSGVKESVDNSTRGTYIDSEGQFVVGDAFNYIKFYKLTNENGEPVLDEAGEPIYKLEISADSILFGDGVKSSAADIKALTEHVKIGTFTDENGDQKPCVELSEGDTSFKQVITNTKTMFMDGENVGTEIDTDGVHTDNLTVNKELRHNNADKTGSFVWAFRSNGNYGLSWKGV